MREPSASHLALARLCAHPFSSGIQWPEWVQSTHGAQGDRVHLGCEGLTTGAAVYPAAYAGLDETGVRYVDRCVGHARRLLEATPPQDWTGAETWIRYHVESGRARIVPPLTRKAPGEWTTIVDWIGVRGDLVLVRDWKTGRQANTEHADTNAQGLLGAVAAAKVTGAKRARFELVYLDEDDYRVDGRDFDRLELAAGAAELRALRRSLTGGPTPPVPGAHCTQLYCPLRGICAATQSALATVQPVGERFSVALRDEEHARWTLERLPGAYAALEAVEAAVKEFARSTPIHLSNGQIYGWRETEKRAVDVDTPERVEALHQALGDFAEVAIVRPPPKVTLESIDEAARRVLEAAGKSRGKAEIVRNALAALEATGGLRVSKYDECKAFKPKRNEERDGA